MLLGYDPIAFLEERDSFKRSLLEVAARAARELQKRHDLERAHQIAESVRKAIFGK